MDISAPGVASVEAKFDVTEAAPVLGSTPQLTPVQFRRDTIHPALVAPIQVLTQAFVGGAYVADGRSVTATTTTDAINKEAVILSVHRQVFIGSIAPENMMPESLSSLFYPHYDWDSLYDHDGNSIEKVQSRAVHKTQVRNASGSGQVIIIQSLVRYIINKSDNGSTS